MTVFAVVRHISNTYGVTDVRVVGVLQTRWEAEQAARVFNEAHDRIAGDATFTVKQIDTSL